MPGRFTVQFNMEDPQQREAAAFLERQGRRKAQIITNALLHYLNCDRASASMSTGTSQLEARLSEIIKGLLNKEFASREKMENDSAQPISTIPQQTMDYSRIEETLLAFDQQ